MAHPPRRTDPAIRARVTELHAAGATRNAIAREVGIAQSTVTLIAGDLGLDFSRERTAAATEAARTDHAARRAALVTRLYDQADAALDRLDRPQHKRAEVSAGQLVRWTAGDLPAQDVKALVQSASAAVDRAVRLEQVDARDGADDVASMLGRLGDALQVAADHLDAEEVPPSDEEGGGSA